MNASENTRNLLRTNSENLDFRALVHLLDQDLAIRDGEEHAFYDQFNKIDKIAHALVAFEGVSRLAAVPFEPTHQRLWR